MTQATRPDLTNASHSSVVAFLRRSAGHQPSQVAVVHDQGYLTYSELLERSLALAQVLPVPESGPEPILVVTDHDAMTPEVYFGILASGNAVVPVSGRLPDLAIHEIATAAGSRLGIVTPGHAHRLSDLNDASAATLWVGHPRDQSTRSLPALQAVLPEGIAMVSFTSGTTGAPKGVLATHTNLIAHGLTSTLTFGMSPSNCQINPLPLSHFAGASRVFLATVNAGTHVLLPEFDPVAVLASIEKHRGTHVTLAPSMARDLLEAQPEQFDLGSLETLIYGTAPMPLQVVSELMERLECGLINGYGLTESTGLVTALDANGHRLATETGDEDLLGSVGFPVPGIELRVVDEATEDVPIGSWGEVMVRGIKITPGYFRDPAKTQERYLPDGWLRTGDRGRLAEGRYLVLSGRLDELIITGGLNVHPLEVETQALLFSDVEACAAFSVQSDRWGQEVRLAVLPRQGSDFNAQALELFLRERLDRYKVPKGIHVVSELPLSALGKVKRSELAERYAGQSGVTD